MKYLVTGGAGFIGSNFIRYIVSKYPEAEVVNLDKLSYAGNLDNLKRIETNPNYKFVKGDIGDAQLVDQLVADCDVIFNFAIPKVNYASNYPKSKVRRNSARKRSQPFTRPRSSTH